MRGGKPFVRIQALTADRSGTWWLQARSLLALRPELGKHPTDDGSAFWRERVSSGLATLPKFLDGTYNFADVVATDADALDEWAGWAGATWDTPIEWPAPYEDQPRGKRADGAWMARADPTHLPVLVLRPDRCMGCGRTSEPGTWMAAPRIGKDVPLYVCPGRHYHGRGDARVNEKCLATAIMRARICAGCGQRARHVDEVCDACRALLERGASVTDVAPYAIGLSHGAPGADGSLVEMLGAAIAGAGATTKTIREEYAGAGVRITCPSLCSEGVRPAMRVDLTATQVDAVRRLLVRLESTLTLVYQRGKREGGSLLAGLADGSLSIGDFNARAER